MLDTLQTVKKFKQIYSTVTILGSGYVPIENFDFGPVFSTFGYKVVEGIRLRVGGRTYFGRNDPWRIQGYTAMVLMIISLNTDFREMDGR
jgi:hypothetical protein